MTERLTDERIAEIQKREEAATPGPWKRGNTWNDLDGYGLVNGNLLVAELFIAAGATDEERATAEADALFFQYAREDVRDLLAEVGRLRRRVGEESQ